MHSSARSLVVLALTVAVLVYPTTVLARERGEEGTAYEGAAAGRTDGKANTTWCLWWGAGCLFGIFGVGAAYVITPSPPVTSLLGKSSDYVAAYSAAYVSSARNEQALNAWIGCGVSALTSAAIFLISSTLSSN